MARTKRRLSITRRTAPTRIVLIDGQRLGKLMVSYGCGVRDAKTIVIKEIDEDFFDLT